MASTSMLPFDVRYVPIGVDYINGMTLETLAEKYDYPPFRIAEILDLPEIKRYIDAQVANIGYNSRLKRAKLIETMIDQKLEEAIESGIYSRKDLAELLKLAQDEAKLVTPKQANTQIQLNQQNNFQTFIEDLLDNDKKDKDNPIEAEVCS